MRTALPVQLIPLVSTLSVVLLLSGTCRGQADEGVVLRSPDGDIRIHFELREAGDKEDVAWYSVSFKDQVLVEGSGLGVTLQEGGPLAEGLRVLGVTRQSEDQTYPVVTGKSSEARNHYNEMVIELEERAEPHRRFDIVFRAYDDGAALRYRFPEQEALSDFNITGEHSVFSLAGNPRAYTLPLADFQTPYEDEYEVVRADTIGSDPLIGLPLLLEYEEMGLWAAVTEADLTDYAGMYLSGVEGEPGTLVSRLSPRLDDPDVKVRGSTPHISPRRVVMIAERPGELIESNLVMNLSDPSVIGDPSWVRPGKVYFPWWNGFVIKTEDFDGGVNTRTIKHYIDFCAEHGIEYCSLDGSEGAWYGGPIQPEQGTDITTPVEGLDIQEVLRYAREKGVRLRVWLHWAALRDQIDEALAVYERWGVEGIMVDYMDRDDQEMVNFYHEMLRKAAKHHLTVTLHGSYKPTGLRRTYPNLLSREGVKNVEYNKFSDSPVTPEHNLTVPFTRMLAGPMDYHQGSFRSVRAEAFETRWLGPVTIGTRCHHLAMYVVYENPMQMVADYPAAYRGQTGLAFLTNVPTSWDQTRVLHGRVGDLITIARCKGDAWYVGSMTGGQARELEVPLGFLGEGKYTADIYADDPSAEDPNRVMHEKRTVTREDVILVKMEPGGGHVMRLIPAEVD